MIFNKLLDFLMGTFSGKLHNRYPHAEFKLHSIKILNLVVTSKTELFDSEIKEISELVDGELVCTEENIDTGVITYIFEIDYKES